MSPARRSHIERVERLLLSWAGPLGAGAKEASRWARAARLHDALRDAPLEELRALAPGAEWPEKALHGPAAAARAERDGERDRGVLEAVRYHTVGYEGWDRVGRMLYLADYLEPGRRHDPDLPALRRRVPADPEGALVEVARRRIGWLLKTGTPIPETTWRFWNRLAAGGW